VPRPLNGERMVSSTNGTGKLDIHMQENEGAPICHTQKLTQMDQTSKCHS
jgi:hypothetical protein